MRRARCNVHAGFPAVRYLHRMDPARLRRVAVSFRTPPPLRSAIEDVLTPMSSLTFLPGLDESERLQALHSAEALMAWHPAREVSTSELGAAPRLKLIQLLSAGADQVRFGDIPEPVTVASNVGAFAEPMAEHVVAMALALAKKLPQKHAEMAGGRFNQRPPTRRIAGLTCGILGLGGIGKATAILMRALGTSIHALNTSGTTDQEVDFIGTLADLDDVLCRSDVVVIALPLTKGTRGLIGRRELGLMKPDAILINVARGAVLEQEALYDHLRANPDFAAGIDAWWGEPFGGSEFRVDFPFFELRNVLGSPHNSAIVPGIEAAAGRRAAENVARFLGGEYLTGVVRSEDYE